MKWVVCILRGGHDPARFTLSATKVYCRRCGMELDVARPAAPGRLAAPATTVKRRALPGRR